MTEPQKDVAPEPGGPPAAEAGAESEAMLREALAERERTIEQLEEKVRQLTEQMKRLAADFDNHRKRQAREMEDARTRAREDAAERLLDVLASFDRALESHGDEEALHQGMVLIHRQLRAALEGLGLERIDSEGHAFDPTRHEAVLREETTSYADGVVVKELEKGWTLNGRVVRPAKVKVAVAPRNPADSEGGDATPP